MAGRSRMLLLRKGQQYFLSMQAVPTLFFSLPFRALSLPQPSIHYGLDYIKSLMAAARLKISKKRALFLDGLNKEGPESWFYCRQRPPPIEYLDLFCT
eukprot:m.92617 g.92617  ORF g.92617 m.92617 type:complete len:98 (-) comp12059_c0_seq2:168-461(-)